MADVYERNLLWLCERGQPRKLLASTAARLFCRLPPETREERKGKNLVIISNPVPEEPAEATAGFKTRPSAISNSTALHGRRIRELPLESKALNLACRDFLALEGRGLNVTQYSASFRCNRCTSPPPNKPDSSRLLTVSQQNGSAAHTSPDLIDSR